MIWNYIYDFLVQYVFGGIASDNVSYSGSLGRLFYTEQTGYTLGTTSSVSFDIGLITNSGDKVLIPLGSWLSVTCTIAIMIIAVILACLLVRWVWRVVSSAFLLK